MARFRVLSRFPVPLLSKPLSLRYGGKAILGPRVNRHAGLFLINEVKEKSEDSEDPQARFILGRYVLTPTVFKTLKEISPNERTGQLELTDALARLLRQREESILACDLNRILLPCAPVRALIEELINAVGAPKKLKKILALTENMLRSIGD